MIFVASIKMINNLTFKQIKRIVQVLLILMTNGLMQTSTKRWTTLMGTDTINYFTLEVT